MRGLAEPKLAAFPSGAHVQQGGARRGLIRSLASARPGSRGAAWPPPWQMDRMQQLHDSIDAQGVRKSVGGALRERLLVAPSAEPTARSSAWRRRRRRQNIMRAARQNRCCWHPPMHHRDGTRHGSVRMRQHVSEQAAHRNGRQRSGHHMAGRLHFFTTAAPPCIACVAGCLGRLPSVESPPRWMLVVHSGVWGEIKFRHA